MLKFDKVGVSMKFKDMNLPNKLTTIRMICVPFVVVLFVLFMLYKNLNFKLDYMFYSNGINYLTVIQVLIAVIFAFASITDFVDGYIARKQKIVSDYGKLMDPLADKMLTNTTIMFLLAGGFFAVGQPSFVGFEIFAMVMAIMVIVRDIFVDALRMQALKKNAVVAASIWGKVKTATLMPGVIIMILGSFHMIIYAIGLTLISIGGIVALIGGIKYFMSLRQYIGE